MIGESYAQEEDQVTDKPQPLKLSARSVKVLFDAAMKLADISNTISTVLAHEKAMNNQGGNIKPVSDEVKTSAMKGRKKGGKKASTPMGEAIAPEETPVNGTVYDPGSLETKNRRDLAQIARKMGLDSKGLKAADIRQAIIDAQGGVDEDEDAHETCAVTGEEAVGYATTEDGEKHPVSQQVIEALAEGAMLDDFLSGDDEVANYI